MTTIAWDGECLAGDTLADYGGTAWHTTKIWRISDGRIFGASGDLDSIHQVKEYLENKTARPKVENFSGMLIDGKTAYKIENGCFLHLVKASFFAVGSGRDIALGAMACGKSAYQAVEIAMRFDVYTGGSIDFIYAAGDKLDATELSIQSERNRETSDA